MTKLRISPDLSLPESTATSTILVLGGKGMGKTNLDAVIAEECAACRIRFSWLDPIGVAWSLQHGATKTEPGLEVLVLGGVHGDIPIEPLAGAIVADLVVDHDVSVVIDISRRGDGRMWSHGEQIRFVTDYAVRLYERQGERRRPLLQIFDEIGRFAPQEIRSGAIDIAKCLGAIEQIVELGRNVGIGMLMSTQRNAKIAASIRELADAMFAFRTVGPLSLKAVTGWLGEHVDAKHVGEIVEQIRKLPVGSAMLVSPGWLQLERVVTVRKRTTFDASATPVAGASGRAPGKARKPDLAKYRELMAATIEKAVADDPKTLRAQLAEQAKRIRELEKAQTAAVQHAERVVTRVEHKIDTRYVLKEGQLARLEKVVERLKRYGLSLGDLSSVITDVGKDVGARLQMVKESASSAAVTTSRDVAAAAVRAGGSGMGAAPAERPVSNREVTGQSSRPRQPQGQRTPPARTTDGISGPQQAILDALAYLESVQISPATRAQTALVARVSSTSSGYEKNVGALRTAGLVTYPRESTLALTADGREKANAPAPATVDELQEALYARLSKPQAALLRVLVQVYPEALDRAALAARADVSETSSGFEKNVGILRTLGLAEYPDKGHVRAAPAIFLEAA